MRKVLLFALVCMLLALPVSPLAAYQGASITMHLFRDGDALTLYVSNEGIVSLEGLTFQVTDIQSNLLTLRLDQVPAFQGLPFDRIAAPVCFHFESRQRVAALPLDCQRVPPSHLFRAILSPADIIWYDSTSQAQRLITVTNGSDDPNQELLTCAADAPDCQLVYVPPALSATPTAVPTQPPAYQIIPLSGQAIIKKLTALRSGPGPQYDIIASPSGGTYPVIGKNGEGTYYQIDYNGTDAWVSVFSQTVSFQISAGPTPTNPNNKPLNAQLVYGQAVNGELSRNQKTDYRFTGLASEVISVVVTSKFDGHLQLLSSDHFTLAEDDNSGGGTNPQINGYTLPKNGEYHIVLSGYSAHDSGKFQLSLIKGKVQATPTRANTIKYGQKVTDFLTPNGQVTLTFNGTQNDVISIEVDADFNNYVQLQDASGTKLVSDNNSGGGTGGQYTSLIDLFTLPTSGNYQIVLRGYASNSSGTYTVQLFQSFSPGEQVTIQYGQTQNAQIDSSGRKVFVFDAKAGDRITVTVQSGFDAHLTVRDARGALVTDDDDSGGNLQPALLDFKIAKTGSYFLVVFGNTPKDFGSFTVALTAR